MNIKYNSIKTINLFKNIESVLKSYKINNSKNAKRHISKNENNDTQTT